MIKKLSNKKLAHYMRNNSNVSKHKSRSIRVARTRKNVSRRTRKFLHRGGEQSPVKVVETVKVPVEPVKVPGVETVKVASKPFEETRRAHNAGPQRTFAPLSSAGQSAQSNAKQADNIFGFPGNTMYRPPEEKIINLAKALQVLRTEQANKFIEQFNQLPKQQIFPHTKKSKPNRLQAFFTKYLPYMNKKPNPKTSINT